MAMALAVKTIQSDEEYEQALEEFGQLMSLSPMEGTLERERYDALAAILEAYESEHYPMELPDPADAITFYLDQHGVGPDSLLPFLHSLKEIEAVLERRRELTLDEIRALHDGLGISAEILIRKPAPQQLVHA